MRFITAVTVSLCTLVSANSLGVRQASSDYLGTQAPWEAGSFGPSPTPEDEQLFITAGRQPNETSSATFEFAPGNLSSSDSTWTWRVNISEVAVPDSSSLRVVNSQWELEWPGGGSLQALVARAGLGGDKGGGLCVRVAEFVLPSNITSRYTAKDQGDCSAVLGNDCMEKLRNRPSSGECEDPLSPTDLQQCMDTLAVAESQSHADPGLLIDSNFNRSIQSGGTFWHHTSSAVAATNISGPLAEAETRLNLLILQEVPGMGESATTATILCQVVDPSASNGAQSKSIDLWFSASGLLAAWILVLL